MPTISQFFGIIVQMFWREHAPPFSCALRRARGIGGYQDAGRHRRFDAKTRLNLTISGPSNIELN